MGLNEDLERVALQERELSCRGWMRGLRGSWACG